MSSAFEKTEPPEETLKEKRRRAGKKGAAVKHGYEHAPTHILFRGERLAVHVRYQFEIKQPRGARRESVTDTIVRFERVAMRAGETDYTIVLEGGRSFLRSAVNTARRLS